MSENDQCIGIYNQLDKSTRPPLSDIPGSDGSCSNITSFFYKIVWPGLGLLGESYMLFSIGTLRPLWEYIIEKKFGEENAAINAQLLRILNQLPYAACCGIICGMLFFGIMADRYGRRIGSISTASCMFIGAVGMTVAAACTIDSSISVLRFNLCWYCLMWSILLFGFGVGGEYPVAAASATERSMAQQQCSSMKSGRRIQLIFTMQGVGILLQVCVLTVLLIALRLAWYSDNVDIFRIPTAFSIIWCALYSVGAAILLVVFVTRLLHLKESSVWKSKVPATATGKSTMGAVRCDASEQKQCIAPGSPTLSCTSTVSSLSIPSVAMISDKNAPETPAGDNFEVASRSANESLDQRQETPFRDNSNSPKIHLRIDPPLLTERGNKSAAIHQERSVDFATVAKIFLRSQYGIRLWSVSTAWFLWDVAFYGNKLFQSSFLLALKDDVDNNVDLFKSMIQLSIAATLNATVALLGYIAAAYVIDHPYFGRRRLQFYGFVLTGCLFLGVGFLYEYLSPTILITMYFGTSFFGQFGPNATTFILPAEIFPTELRTLCHGIAAASGKLGALTATIVFHRVSKDLDLFLFSGYASFIAAIVTYWFIPETAGHDLSENDRHWNFVVSSYLTSNSSNPQRRNVDDHFHLNPTFLSVYERRKELLRLNRGNEYQIDEDLLYT